jgi:hypothetical protein
MKKDLFRKIISFGMILFAGFCFLNLSLEAAQTEFVIGVWLEASPETLGYTETTAYNKFNTVFSKISLMGFNTVEPSNLPHHWPTVVEDFMSLAETYNLKVILDPGEGHNLMKYSYQDLQANRASWKSYLKTTVTDRFKNYSSLLGYSVIEEPSLYQCFDLNGNPVTVSKSEKLARWNLIVELLDELDPAHADYTVFRDPSWLETAVNTYSRKGINYDNYPFEDQVPYYVMGPANEYGWYIRYQAYSEACQSQFNVPQISTIQSFSEGVSPWRFPKAEELRTCVYTSLAAGAKGVILFL